MPERRFRETRDLLTYKMLPTHKEILDIRVFGTDRIKFFKDSGTEMANTAFFTGIALGEYYGLGRLQMLTLTAQTPIQLANSMGAIASVSNAYSFYGKFVDTDYFKRRHDAEIEIIKSLGGDKAEGSIPAERFVSRLRQQALTAGTATVLPSILTNIEAQQPDSSDLSVLIESYFLLALGADKPGSKLNPELAKLMLRHSAFVFKAVEAMCNKDQQYFELVYGKQASFWRDFRFDLIPGLEVKASGIRKALENREDTHNTQVITNMPGFFQSGSNYLSDQKQQAERARAERDRQERQRIYQKNLAREKADRLVNPEKWKWLDAKADFEQKWDQFIQQYEKNNGQLSSPPNPNEFIDLFTGGADILHEAIFAGKTDLEIRAGIETILPKFWSGDQLRFVVENVLDEYSYDQNGNPERVIFGEKVLAHIVYLPKHLRPAKLGSDFTLLPAQQTARNTIVRSLSWAAHPDIKYAHSDPKDAKIVEEFIRVVNGYKNYIR